MGMFNKVQGRIAGLNALCSHYQELGIDASILPDDSPEALPRSKFVTGEPDWGYIKVEQRNFDLVTIKTGGWNLHNFGLRGCLSGCLSGCLFGLIKIPLSEKEKEPRHYQHIVRPGTINSKTKLKKKKKGKEIIAATWKGGELETILNSDPEIQETLLKFLTKEDSMSIKPDKKNNVTRIVFSRPIEKKLGLLHGGFKYDRRLYPIEAVEAIDKIAGLVRNHLAQQGVSQ